MNRIIPAGCLAALFLAGCNSPSQHTPVPRNYGAASDVAVTRHTQYTLWDKGVFSGQLPVSTGSHLLTANSDRLSFDWEGDAIELLNELARVRGMQFNYNGVRLPLPVNLHVRDMTFSNTLRLIEAQTAWRATIHQYPGLLQSASCSRRTGKNESTHLSHFASNTAYWLFFFPYHLARWCQYATT
ncbi:Uncharacterised protein [Shigella sonnei]|nr:Uncharacterised protein [Shigella sonnei]